MLRRPLTLLIALAALAWGNVASAANFSFTGNFEDDDDVVLFSFTLDSPQTVELETLSYLGGINSAGMSVLAGGFDPILTLFHAAGAFIDENDDINTGAGNSDSRIVLALAAGSYILALTQFDNVHLGDLADGFAREGQPSFTGTELSTNCGGGMFKNFQCLQRTSAWAVDIWDVTTAVPEPTTLLLLGSGLGALAVLRRGARA